MEVKGKKKVNRYKGVSLYRRTGKFRAFLYRANGTQKHLGYFFTAKEAAKVYDKIVCKYHGDLAILNFPKSETSKNLP